jgi:hypothetical protein
MPLSSAGSTSLTPCPESWPITARDAYLSGADVAGEPVPEEMWHR